MTGLFWAVAAAALAMDVGSKLWAVRSLEQAVTVLPGILELRLSRNNGMALGLLSGNWLANLLLPLVVIVAGYDGLMERFIHSNPGLESRFNRYLHFDDYTIAEMVRIFEMQCKKGCYVLDEDTKKAVQLLIADRNTNSVSFGNARGVRNIFEQILTAQCNRLAELDTLTREDLMKITQADVEAVRALPAKKLT